MVKQAGSTAGVDVTEATKGTSRAGKAIFADQLRALACLCVIAIHWGGIYWVAREVVARSIFAPVLEGPNEAILQWVTVVPSLNLGPFGVALFFLISGFVIPFSLANTSRLRFLAARALRIYPTYIVCLAIGLFITYLSSMYWGKKFDWPLMTIVKNFSLYKGVGLDSIDLINWSLAVELKFYLLVAVLFTWIQAGRILPLLAVSAFLALAMHGMSQDLLFVPFMFIGTIFSYHFRQKISVLQLLASAALLIGLFIACWTRSVLKEQFPIVPMNYFYALGLFTVAYCLRDRFRPIKPVDWLASISYPLYAVHSIVGYASVRFLTALGVSYYPALAATAVFVAVLAYIVHRTVETPTMHVGKRIAKHVPAGYLPNAAESKAG